MSFSPGSATSVTTTALPSAEQESGSVKTNATTTEKMLGFALTYTPTQYTNALIIAKLIAKNDTAGDATACQPRYGTGAAPANGDAVTGTVINNTGIGDENIGPLGANVWGTHIFVGKITGLTLATAYWLDFSGNAVTGGTATFEDVQIIILEVP